MSSVAHDSIEFQILGPVAVRSASGDISLGGNKPRAVLAVLLLHPNQPVSAERLALALWGEDAPGGAVKTVQVHVSRLRKALGDPDVLTTTAAGYSLRVRQDELDAERFEGLVEDARQAMADGQAESAAAILRDALALWRGPALAELANEPFAIAEISRLHEQRLAALELRVDADLAAGRHAELVGELQTLVVDNPLREQLAAQLMLALYRCGRQTEALEAYASARRTLVEEMGIEPGPELRRRHEAILRQDASLQAQASDVQLPAALDPSNAQPLVGREEELGWLLARWHAARNGGGGAVVALAGPRGVGKTRLVAELARHVHRPGVTVLHASGDGPADSTLVALRRARDAARPTLLVIDDADRAGAGVLDELARVEQQLADAVVLVVVSAEEPAALAPLRPAGVLELGPIGAEAVREIAARYAPIGATADVPALLEASAGMPRRVHEAASQWARREAAHHVGAVADRAETGRAELRLLESELAGGVAELQEHRTRVEPGRRDDTPAVCPFTGLATFDAADARYFYGRERLVAELVARLVGAQMLAVVGPSGSGKSSVLRAGLLPALATGVLPGSEKWQQVLIRPGRHPLRELAAAFDDVSSERRVVLAIDQFEETFTVCNYEQERAEFISELVQAARDPRRRYVIVIALRADRYGSCAAYPELATLLAENHVLVGAMASDELRRAIEGPCERARLSIEPALVDALVDDVEHEPGGLPLLSTSLLELWQRRDGRRLRHSTYVQIGGVHGAVARLAEDAFAQLDDAQQAAGRSALMRLVGTGEGDTVERQRIALDDLEIDRDTDAARVVALLTDRRLLTVGAGSVELAHEALLREWPRLRGWIEEDRDGLRIQRSLGLAAQEWERLNRDPGALYRGLRLTEALKWRDERCPRLNELERGFLARSEEAQPRDRITRLARLRRRPRRARAALGTARLDGGARGVNNAARNGANALERMAYKDASKCFEDALRALEMGPRDRALRGWILLALGHAELQTGRLERGRATLDRAVHEARQLGDGKLLAEAALALMPPGSTVTQADEIKLIPFIQEALDHVAIGDSASHAKLLARMARAMLRSATPSYRDSLAEEAVAMARRVGDPATLAYVLADSHSAISHLDAPERALRCASEISAIAQTLDNKELALRTHSQRMSLLLTLGQLTTFAGETDKFRKVAGRRDQRAQGFALVHRCAEAIVRGRFVEAETLLGEATSHATLLRQDSAFTTQLGALAFVMREAQGELYDLSAGMRHFAESHAAFPVWRCGTLCVALQSGRQTELQREYNRFVDEGFRTLQRDDRWLPTVALLAEVCAHLGDCANARALQSMLTPYAGRNVIISGIAYIGPVDRYLALLASAEGNDIAATDWFASGRALAQQMGARPTIVRLALDEARWLHERDPPRAARYAADAVAGADAIGLDRLASHARELLEEMATHDQRR